MEVNKEALIKMLEAIKKDGLLTIDLNNPELLEALAEIEHRQWAHWMEYLKSKGFHVVPQVGDEIVFAQKTADWDRWEQQMKTEYIKLSEKEKESDRAMAKIVIAALANGNKELFS